MNILVVHNFYRQPGGEDAAVRAECDALRRAGHRVSEYFESNTSIDDASWRSRLLLASGALWRRKTWTNVAAMVRDDRPDVVHFHNTWPLVGAAGYHACHAGGVPVVQTLHNYRVFCAAGTFFRDGRICEECVGRGHAPAVIHACYRDSRPQTAVLAASLHLQRALGVYSRLVQVFIVPSRFARDKFVSLGLDARRIEVKPNFVPADPGPRSGAGAFALYAGRLSREKGLDTLLEAWRTLPDIPLRILGDGPLRGRIADEAARLGLAVTLSGRRSGAETMAEMLQARVLVFPAESYEGFPLVLAEAFAAGLPVVATRLGAMQEIVDDGVTGSLFEPGDHRGLAERIRWAWTHPSDLVRMGEKARSVYERHYTAEINVDRLVTVYRKAIGLRPTSARPAAATA